MSNNEQQASQGGVGVIGLLWVLLIGLKLMEYNVYMSWFWVIVFPIWASLVIIGGFIAIAAVIFLVVFIFGLIINK